MTEQMGKIDGLPEVVEYGGYLVEYVGTSTFTDAHDTLWYRHEYAYRDMPHITERVYFFRAEGDDEPIADVTGFEVFFHLTTRQRRKYKWFDGRHVASVEPRHATKSPESLQPLDNETAQQKTRQLLSWIDNRREKREEKRKAAEDRKTSRDLSKRIRSQVKPFGLDRDGES